MHKMSALLRGTTLALSLAAASPALAYTIASLDKTAPDPARETHVLVVGRGRDLGRLFAQSAIAQAYRYRALQPESQIVLIAARERDGEKETDYYQRQGTVVHRADSKTLSGLALIGELKKFTKIVSLDIYAHTAWIVGSALDSELARFDEDSLGVGDLKKNFAPGAFAFLHGCNSGFKMGPSLAKKWGVPVLGSLTSTDFQRLHQTGEWYNPDPGRAPDNNWAATNPFGYASPLSCKKGLCLRMRPDNFPYTGAWGEFSAGLGFFKAACPWGDDVACRSGLRNALAAAVSSRPITLTSGIDDVKAAIKDFLCPVGKGPALRKACFEGLEKAVVEGRSDFTPYKGDSLSCTEKGCAYETPCKPKLDGIFVKPHCKLARHPQSQPSTALVDEYLLYLRAFTEPDPPPAVVPAAEPEPSPSATPSDSEP
jgi:hypothetical protein